MRNKDTQYTSICAWDCFRSQVRLDLSYLTYLVLKPVVSLRFQERLRSDFDITGAHAQWYWELLVRMCSDFDITGAHAQWYWELLVCLSNDFEITGAQHAQWFWYYWCACAVILRLLVGMRSDFENTCAHTQWFWDYCCACAVILRLLVRMRSDVEITCAHAQWFWDYWCACAVIWRKLVRMRSHFEITGAHAQWFWDLWCACAMILRLLIRMRSYFDITVAHAHWVLDPPGGSSFRSNFSRPLAIKSKSSLSPSPHTLCGEEFTPFPQLIISSHLFPALYLLHTRHHSSLLKSSLCDLSQGLSNFSPVLSLLYVHLVVHRMYHRVDRVLGFFASRPNWDPPYPLTRRRVCTPLWFREGTHSLVRVGMGGPNSDQGTDNVAL